MTTPVATNEKLPPAFGELPVKFNHWGEPIQRSELHGLLAQGVLLKGLQAYGWHRIRPGGFLQACLANDFTDALCRIADPITQVLVQQIALYIHNHLPATCHGSREAVENWIEGRTHDAIAVKPQLEFVTDVGQVKGAQQA